MAHGRTIGEQSVDAAGGRFDVFQSNDEPERVLLVATEAGNPTTAESGDGRAWVMLSPAEALELGGKLIAEARHAERHAAAMRELMGRDHDADARAFGFADADALEAAGEDLEDRSVRHCAHAYLEADATCSVCGRRMADLERARLEALGAVAVAESFGVDVPRVSADEAREALALAGALETFGEDAALELARYLGEDEDGPSPMAERAWDAREDEALEARLEAGAELEWELEREAERDAAEAHDALEWPEW